ncbi:hypothetical protein [Streptomyces sp. NRRL S-495]|uniref:hypothetical protein n=1 Tax=Streptomyces sp. NRRL S-495 TaxID=1609133 RepID=UPI000AAF5B5E|nr:hypothetical protein [Streptomyces sp. NRRL S-495]
MATQEPIQLEGKELEQLRALMREVDANLRQIHELTVGHVRGEKSKFRPRNARFHFDNTKVVFIDDAGCGVYEDPPGICRTCKLEDLTIDDE